METSRRRERRYRLTPERQAIILAEQGGLCAICRERPPTDVDHCHAAGKFRGLLCRSCNLGIGMFADDPAKLKLAIAYLERPLKSLSDRLPIPKRWTGPPPQKGEKCHSAKLTEQDVRTMRSEYAAGGVSYPDLGRKYNIHAVTVGRIVRRKEWAHVD
jgi:hypothetical protein